ncbi:coiled-coil domain-containing protein 12-like [Centruroides sculpturatus]|uniref:coiled-coil domain-containing protein 12-like n=1 Tax=Centruroides sculpturatus TaxID=218467 RepID=UPI000C6E2885|nr:coiled-coil domain-containing protein 12-like [Centruroides sculpturatus]
MALESNIGNLEEEALKRKERLRLLRDKAKGKKNEEKETSNNKEELPKPVFRSYQPQDKTLQENILPKTKPESVEEEVQDHVAAGNPEPLINEVDLSSLAPRKPDWDLKRDAAKKLEKLQRRTERAIAELIRERISSGGQNLAEAVNTIRAENVDSE